MPHTRKALVLETWRRVTLWESRHRPIARLVGMTAGLVVLLAFLPANMRIALWQGLQSNKTLAILLAVFSLLAISLAWSTGQHVDAWAFLLFNVRGPRPVWLDWIMLVFTQIGGAIGALGIAFILFFTGDRLLSFECILGAVTLWLVVELFKFIVHRSRPFIRLTETRIVGYRAIGRSFPSGHSSQAFFMATLIAQHFHSSVWVICLLYAAALLVSLTRIYIGAHYPRDVLAGVVLGSAWGMLGMIVEGYVLNWIGLN
jgi:membrane-associated phospholipid phosphatase